MRLWKTMGKTAAAIGAMATLLAVQAVAQDDKVTVPFRDASKPRTLVVNLLNGSITVHGSGTGNEAVVEGSGAKDLRSRRPEMQGMHRIDNSGGGYEITEENNVITVHAGMNSSSLSITVPAQINLKLKTVNGGKLVVDGVSGDIDAENTNGPITITNCSGSVLANSLNGKVLVTLDRITAGKEMSFSSMNGNVECDAAGRYEGQSQDAHRQRRDLERFRREADGRDSADGGRQSQERRPVSREGG